VKSNLFGLLFFISVPVFASDLQSDESSTDNGKKLWERTVSVTSNYVFSGISNSDNRPALQGGVTLNDIWTQSGVYLNVWGSSVRFPDAVDKTVHLEIDTILGVRNTIGKNFNYDVHFIRYNYPCAKGIDYNDFIASGQFYLITGLIGYSPDVYATGKQGTYLNLGFKYDIPEDVIDLKNINISGGIGYYKLPRSVGLRSYADYNLQISKTFKPSKDLDLVIALQWTNTNRKSVDPSRLKRNHVVGTMTLNF
jgi:uncharacterized protein (TIGR02001 family)